MNAKRRAQPGTLFNIGGDGTRTRTVCGEEYTVSAAHPEADANPWMSDAELVELAEDIRTVGQRHTIKRLPGGALIDGRNRELACRIADVEPTYEEVVIAEADIAGFVESENDHRRHLSAGVQGERRLTREQRRERVAAALQANPSKSDNAIGAVLGVSDKTVASVRRALVRRSEIPNTGTRTDTTGRVQPARKPKSEPKSPDPDPELLQTEQTLPPVPPARLANRVSPEEGTFDEVLGLARRLLARLQQKPAEDTPQGRALRCLFVKHGVCTVHEEPERDMDTGHVYTSVRIGGMDWLRLLVQILGDAKKGGDGK